jgi:DNA-directed RNA polymerase subunit RPC12/RpoP
MKKDVAAKQLAGGNIEPAHRIEIVCAACGFDLDESELGSDKCSDCGAELDLKQNVTIEVTSIPAFGEILE